MIEEIKAHGTVDRNRRRDSKPTGKIVCADGFNMSVQAGTGMYCIPRPDSFDGSVDKNYEGPYSAAEVGFPSERPEPWLSQWRDRAEESDHPTKTVYGFVPFEMIEALIALHGGEVE